MDLGKKLRQAISKLTNKPYVDEDAVKALIKDLQRVLISSDVSVKLVFKLSKKIEERALKSKKLEALSLKEHVMKVVYEELVSLMGETYKPRLDKHKILLCGLFGSGKCIHKNSTIPLANGDVKTIKEIYEQYTESGEEKLIDGFKVECKNGPEIYAFNKKTLKIEKRKATTLWKLKKNSKLLKVSLDNGNNHSIIVTPEHPFFSLNNGNVDQLRAEQLKKGQYIAAPTKLEFDGPTQRLENIILDKFMNFKIADKRITSEVKIELLKRFNTLENAHGKLGIKEAYCTFTWNLKRDIIPMEIIKKLRKIGIIIKLGDYIKIKGSKLGSESSGRKSVKINLTIDQKIAEFLGYVFGDGYIYKNYVEITNNDKEILMKVKELTKNLFGLSSKIKKDKRNGVTRVFISSKTLVHFLTNAFGLSIGKKSHSMQIPEVLLKSPKDIVKGFVRAYFDTDGYVEKHNRHIELCSASKVFLDQLRIVLLRYSIFSNVSIRTINGKNYHRLFIKSDDVFKFHNEFSSILPRKRARFEKLAKITGQTPGKHQMIYTSTDMLREVREAHGFSIGEVQQYVSSYGMYESKGNISRSSLSKFLTALKKPHKNWIALIKKIKQGKNYQEIITKNTGWATASIYRLEQQNYVEKNNNRYRLTNLGENALYNSENFDGKKLDQLDQLAYSDVCWLRVKSIEEVDKEEYVYDLTVDDLHTFIANGIVVHNTTSVSKIAHFYKTKGLSVAMVAADVDRPAAQEQLEQLSKQVNAKFYTIKGEKNASKIVKDALEKSKEEVIIVDSAGRSAFDDELAKELKGMVDVLKPDETYLVVSGDIGQVAGKQAEQFQEIAPLSGVIATKMDGSGKGGGALSAVSAANSKIAFIGVGEKPSDFEVYNSEKFVGRLLGVPDIEGLIEKAKKATEGTDIEKLQTEKLTIESFYEQLKAAKKMGPLGNVFSMLGANDLPKELVEQSEEKLKKYESMINSMTKAEKKNASLLRAEKARVDRIAKGSGCSEKEIREFLSQFDKMEKMMGRFRKDRGLRRKLEQMMQGGQLQNMKMN